MERVTRILAVVVVSAVLVVPMAVSALEPQPTIKSEVIMETGNKVHLFHSGTADVKREICLNDVIPVYRETMAGGHTTSQEVGKVKVLSYVGEHYFEAEVVAGKIKVGDVAKKTTATCLVQP